MGLPRICLDAGHGGSDPGTVWGDYREKDAALSFVLDLKALLDKKPVRTIVSRSADEYVTLSERCVIANSYHSDVFLSVHLNAVPEEKRRAGVEAVGMETWTFEGSKKALAFAEEILEVVGSGFSGYHIRGVRETNKFHVLKGTTMPAVLLELGFIDSLHDRTLLQGAESRKRLLQLVADGLLHACASLCT